MAEVGRSGFCVLSREEVGELYVCQGVIRLVVCVRSRVSIVF